MTISSGSRLGPYEVLSPIGAGGMGEVYRARDTRLDRSVAVKILPAEFGSNASLKLRFEREARTISQLNHPHICVLHDVGEARLETRDSSVEDDPDSPSLEPRAPSLSYLVMELLEGETLADRLERGPLPMMELLRYGHQIADALDKAHRNGVIHRDLKPGNIMITKSGAKLLDFGLAKSSAPLLLSTREDHSDNAAAMDAATAHRGNQPLTEEGTILGTFQYMAPEQLEGKEADPRTDIFALGALLYEMATGRRAFRGQTKASLIASIVGGHPEAVRTLQPLTPPSLEHVIQKCLEKDPDDRWQSAHDIAEELRWIGEAGSQAGLAVPITVRRKHRERLAWSFVALLVACSAWLGWTYWQEVSTSEGRIEFELHPPFGTNLVPFDEAGVAISPDGTKIAFVAIGSDGKRRLWLRDLGSVSARELPDTAGASYPFWSPDGAHLGFFAEEKLKRINVAGGPPQVICGGTPSGRGATWSEDGTILFAPTVYSGIWRVSASGGTPKEVTKLDPESDVTHRWPLPLPDGAHFLYLLRSKKDGTREPASLIAASFDGKTRKVVLDNATNVVYHDGQLLYGRDRSLMIQPFDLDRLELTGEARMLVQEKLSYWEAKNLLVYSVSKTGALVYLPRVDSNMALRVVDRSGDEEVQIMEKGELGGGSFSPDGRYVAYSFGDTESQQDIWLYDLQRNRANRITFQPGTYSGLSWSPESQWLYFVAQPKGQADIYRKLIGSGAIEEFAGGPSWKLEGSLSPDGKIFCFGIQSGETGMDLWMKPTDEPDAVPTLYLQTPSDEVHPQFSPDGRWISYTSNATGRPEVYVRSVSGLDQWQVSSEGGVNGRWRQDGKEMFYASSNGKIMAVAIGSGAGLDPGEPVALFGVETPTQLFVSGLSDVSPDGTRFLVTTPSRDQAPPAFHVVLNWGLEQDR